MSVQKFETKVGRPLFVRSSNICLGYENQIFGLDLSIYDGYTSETNYNSLLKPYILKSLSNNDSRIVKSNIGLRFDSLGSTPFRDRDDCIFLLKDIDTFVDKGLKRWFDTIKPKYAIYNYAKFSTTKEEVEKGGFYLQLQSKEGPYESVKLKVYTDDAKLSALQMESIDRYSYKYRKRYLFNNKDIARLKKDLKDIVRAVNQRFDANVNDYKIDSRGAYFINGKYITM